MQRGAWFPPLVREVAHFLLGLVVRSLESYDVLLSGLIKRASFQGIFRPFFLKITT